MALGASRERLWWTMMRPRIVQLAVGLSAEAARRTSRYRSRVGSTPPSAISALRRVSSGVIPARMLSAMWAVAIHDVS